MQDDKLTAFIQKVLEMKEEKDKELQLLSENELDDIARELEIDPAEIKNKAQEHYVRGKNFMEFHNYENAKKELEEAVVLQPNYLEALISLALTLQQLWQTSQDDNLRLQAIYHAEQVIQMNPDEKNAYKIISYLKYEESSPDKKITLNTSYTQKPSYSNNRYKQNDSVRVYWFGKYYDASVTAIQDGKYKIHYAGYDNKSDEWISEYRILGSPSNQTFKWTVRGLIFLVLIAVIFSMFEKTAISNKDAVNVTTPVHSENTPLKVGDKVQVLWKSSYYQAEILEISGSQYKIHYAGYSDTWDEWITRDRIK